MCRSLASWLWCRSLSVVVAGLVLCIAIPARAGIVVSVESVSATAGTTGNTLEVDIQNTGPATVDIAAFAFELTVTASSGVTFTGADINTTTNPYIFTGNSLFGPNIGTTSNMGMTLDASDGAVSGSTALGTGSTLGLGRVFFDVSASAQSGPVTVSLTPFPVTNLSDPNLNNISIDTLSNGTITISGGTVPEPSALVSAGLGILLSACLVYSMRRTALPARG
jgi:hypothetical protein